MTADRSPRGRLDDDQVAWLLKPLQPYRVGTSQGHAHMQAWDVRRHLLRVFGWGGWDEETVAVTMQHADFEERTSGSRTWKAWTVVYTAVVRLTIRNRQGEVVAVFEEGAAGDANAQPKVGDAHDFAMKSALSQALKRCAANLGDGFGLSLYNGGKLDPVVGRSLGHPEPEEERQAPDLGAGDEQVEEEAHDRPQAAQDAATQAAAGEEDQAPPWTPQGAASHREDGRQVAAQEYADRLADVTDMDGYGALWREGASALGDVMVTVPVQDEPVPLSRAFSIRRRYLEEGRG